MSMVNRHSFSQSPQGKTYSEVASLENSPLGSVCCLLLTFFSSRRDPCPHCDFSWGDFNKSLCTTETAWKTEQREKEIIPSKSSLVNQCVSQDYLQDYELLEGNCQFSIGNNIKAEFLEFPAELPQLESSPQQLLTASISLRGLMNLVVFPSFLSFASYPGP